MGEDQDNYREDTVAADSGSEENNLKHHESIHRRNLERLATDSNRSKRHVVPDSSVRPKNPAWYTKEGLQAYEKSVTTMTSREWLETLVPLAKTLKGYDWREKLPKDLISGCTVGFMVIPQSLSYAKLAGLDVQYGLYSALLPTMTYAFFGTSRQLAVGPVALVSLVVGTAISDLLKKRGVSTKDKAAYKALYVQIAIQTSFLVGVVYMILGLLRLGFVTILLSHAVVSGFISASAIIIGSSQLKYWFGYSIPQTEILHHILHELVKRFSQFNWKTFLLGIAAFAVLQFMKQIGTYVPKLKYLRVLGPLTVTIFGIILDAIIGLANHGVPVVAFIPEGLPHSTIPLWTPIHSFSEIVPVVLSVGLVGFMESIAIAKKMAAQHKYSIDASSELLGLGLANFIGSMAGAYPVTGSFSRSAVNNDTGAQSGISALVTGIIVLFVLLFLTFLFERVPLAILGSIVISAVVGLFDYAEPINLWKIDKFDFGVWVISFVGTLFLGVEIGLLIAVGVSLLLVIYESAYPHTAILGRLPGTTVYRNVKQYPEAETFDGILLVRVDAPMYFANVQNIRDKLTKYEELAKAGKMDVKYLVLDLSPVAYIDTSAIHVLKDTIDAYEHRGIDLCFSNPSVVVMERLLKSEVADRIGRDHIFVTVQDAVEYCLQQLEISESEHDIKVLGDVEEQSHQE